MNKQPAKGIQAKDIPSGGCITGKVGGEEVAIFNVEGTLYATQNACTHMGGPLCQGGIWGDTVTCPWHGSEFNIKTGEVVQGPAKEPLKTYKMTVQDGELIIGNL